MGFRSIVLQNRHFTERDSLVKALIAHLLKRLKSGRCHSSAILFFFSFRLVSFLPKPPIRFPLWSAHSMYHSVCNKAAPFRDLRAPGVHKFIRYGLCNVTHQPLRECEPEWARHVFLKCFCVFFRICQCHRQSCWFFFGFTNRSVFCRFLLLFCIVQFFIVVVPVLLGFAGPALSPLVAESFSPRAQNRWLSFPDTNHCRAAKVSINVLLTLKPALCLWPQVLRFGWPQGDPSPEKPSRNPGGWSLSRRPRPPPPRHVFEGSYLSPGTPLPGSRVLPILGGCRFCPSPPPFPPSGGRWGPERSLLPRAWFVIEYLALIVLFLSEPGVENG